MQEQSSVAGLSCQAGQIWARRGFYRRGR
jgi:hypothetical protein